MSVSMQLYVIGALEILIPIIVLMVLHKKHKFRISSVISGVGCYFLAANLLTGTFIMFLSSLGLSENFWNTHPVISNIVNVTVQVIFQNITIYLAMKYVLKKRVRIYDGIAIGISYWIYNALTYSTSTITYARIANLSLKDNLSSMVSESLSLETLEEYAAAIWRLGISSFYIQLLGMIVLSCMTAVVCVFLFHALKRGNLKIFFAATGCNLIAYALLDLAYSLLGDLWYVVACFAVIIVSVIVFIQYWKWYKQQQAELIRKKQEYAKYLKAAGGNVVSVKPSDSEMSSEEEVSQENN